MRITTRQFGEAIVLNLNGRLVGREASRLLESTVQQQRALHDIRTLVLNLAQVEVIDGGGLRALSAGADLMRRASGCLRLAGINERLSNPVMNWLLTTFSTFETVEDAVDDVRRGLELAAASRARPRDWLRKRFRQFRERISGTGG